MSETSETTVFKRYSLGEAYLLSQQSERWVFQDTICSSVTLIYGKSNVGKSYLVSSMVSSLLVEGREFLGMQPVDKAKLWRPAIVSTDPGTLQDYGEQIYETIPSPSGDEVDLFAGGLTIDPSKWELFTEEIVSNGNNFVVLDNLMGLTGDTNSSERCTVVFDAMAKLNSHGIPTVLLHHESEHGFSATGANPMGSSVIVQKSRQWIQVRQTNRRGLRGGNTAMIIRGNRLDQPQHLVAAPMPGPNFRVLNRGPWESVTEPPKKQDRDKSTLDRNAEIADWVVSNCQGLTVRQASDKVAAEFDGAANSYRTWLRTEGRIGVLLERDGTVWKRRG